MRSSAVRTLSGLRLLCGGSGASPASTSASASSSRAPPSSRTPFQPTLRSLPPQSNVNVKSRRLLHSSPTLDPVDSAANNSLHVAQPPHQDDSADTQLSGAQAFTPSSTQHDHVFVPLRHLHESTVDDSVGEQHVPLSAHVFALEPRRDIMHSAVVYYLDSQRSGTASTKTRGEVNFSGAKIRPQKGTGNARMGTRGNPLMRKGGVIHGPKPRDFATDLPRRVRELALRSALSARWQEGKLHVVPSLYWDPPPKVTGKLAKALATRGWQDTLFLSAPRHPQAGVKEGLRQRPGRPSALDPTYAEETRDQHGVDLQPFAIALANLPQTELIRLDMLTEEAHEEAKKPEEKKKPGELHAYEVLLRDNVVMDLGALEWLEEKLGGSIAHEDATLLGHLP